MKMRKMMATVITVALALSTMSMSALAAQKASIEGGDAGLGNKITVNYDNQDYGFTQKNGKWEADDGFAEQGLGRDGEASVTVTGDDTDNQVQEEIKSEPVYTPVYDDDDDYDYEDYEDEPEIEIVEEEVPLADVPKTGDPMALWMTLSGISAAGLVLLNKKGKED